MPRTKKPSSNQPPVDENPLPAGADEAVAIDGMAHVPVDELAASPDVFAPKSNEPPAEGESLPDSPDEGQVVNTSPIAVAEPSSAAPEAPVAPPPPPPAPATPAPVQLAPAAAAFAPAPAPRRAGSSTAVGIVLVVVGVFFLAVRVFDIDLSAYGWPLFVIIPGLTLLVVGFFSLGTGAAIPGGIVTMVGLVLAYQNATNDWASWVYSWALVAPGGVGLGMFLQGVGDRNVGLIKQGRSLMFIALLIFTIGFVFFESILNISGMDYGLFGKAALPGLLVAIGLVLLVRSVRTNRRA